MSILYVVATPIGNLSDITFRAIDVLKNVDCILAEDTRVTKKLLNHYEIETKLISFHEYSDEKKYEKIFDLLANDSKIALVCDAGTPAISDPGYFLVQKVREKMPEVKIIPIAGPSALTTFVSVSGVNTKEFTFLGFPPHKKGRQTFFENVLNESSVRPVIFYESKHRLVKALDSIMELGEKNNDTEKLITIGRELTKTFEEIIQGDIKKVINYFQNNPEKNKGEFVIMIS
jgi:16S rRNA (cytidine1402-2'-O)-methyltransferase